MPIRHKFYHSNFGNGFETNMAILDIIPYKPEVMFIGTFNHDTPNANFEDFFYGRNFFWTALKNLFIYNEIVLLNRRMLPHGASRTILDLTLFDIFELCIRLKFTFSDFILEVLHNDEPAFQLWRNDNVIFNGSEYNIFKYGRCGLVGGLHQLDLVGQINWNTQNILKYLGDNLQIKSVYYTGRTTGIWAPHWNNLLNHECMKGRIVTNISPPSGAGASVNHSMEGLLKHWVHNNNRAFGKLDNNWLTINGVNPDNF